MGRGYICMVPTALAWVHSSESSLDSNFLMMISRPSVSVSSWISWSSASASSCTSLISPWCGPSSRGWPWRRSWGQRQARLLWMLGRPKPTFLALLPPHGRGARWSGKEFSDVVRFRASHFYTWPVEPTICGSHLKTPIPRNHFGSCARSWVCAPVATQKINVNERESWSDCWRLYALSHSANVWHR